MQKRFRVFAIFGLDTTCTTVIILSLSTLPPALPEGGGGELVLNGNNATNKMPELAKPNLAELITGRQSNNEPQPPENQLFWLKA